MPAAIGINRTSVVLSKIALLSDSHGRDKRTSAAMQLLLSKKPDAVIHLGDVGNLEVIDALVEVIDAEGALDPPVYLVFGNVDWDYMSMDRYAESLGIQSQHPVGRLELDGKTIVFQHGHEDVYMREAIDEGVDFLCHGHTHQFKAEQQGKTLVVNPGALFRASKYTVCIVDTESNDVEFFEVD